jgi:vacuolar-type H+-ATPase subunit H
MITPGTMETELSPLDQIRQTESDVTRQIAAAREAAEYAITEAKSQVKELLDEARVSGHHRGQIRYKEVISQAEEEAHALVTQAHSYAEALHKKGKQRMNSAVYHAVNLVIGMERGDKDK